MEQRRTLRLGRPLDLGATLWPLRRGLSDPSLRLGRDTAVRATRTPEGAAAVRMEVRNGALEAEAVGPGASWALEALPDLVGEADDVSDFRPRHPVVRDLHHRHPGLRITRSRAVFDALVASVLEQLILGADARRNYARLVLALGEPVPGGDGLVAPPAPERLATTPYWVLHGCGVERRRAEVLAACSRRAGRVEETSRMELEPARRRLEALPGVGPWTAAEVALVALGDADAVSLGDYHLPHQVCWALAGEARGDDQRMLDLLEPFRGHRGRVIRLLMAGGLAAPRRGPRSPRRDIARL